MNSARILDTLPYKAKGDDNIPALWLHYHACTRRSEPGMLRGDSGSMAS